MGQHNASNGIEREEKHNSSEVEKWRERNKKNNTLSTCKGFANVKVPNESVGGNDEGVRWTKREK